MFGSKKASSKSGDWATQAADAIEGLIDGIRNKAVLPLTTIARGIVYGLLALIVGFMAAILVAIAFVRILNIYLGNALNFASSVWAADLIVGAIFVIAGLFLWSKRYKKA